MPEQNTSKPSVRLGAHPALLAAISVVAIAAAFALAAAPFALITKASGFLAIVAVFLAITAAVYSSARRSALDNEPTDAHAEQILAVLEEISQFFAGTIKTADAFRLVVSKVSELMPFDAVVLAVIDRDLARIRVVQAYGEHSDELGGADAPFHIGLAGKCADLGTIQVEHQVSGDITSTFAGSRSAFLASAALPLKRQGEVLAIMQFYSVARSAFDRDAIAWLEAVGERAAPMILGSLSYESSVSSALTDTATGLPNERAFRMVLENQIAESHRRGSERPLTILAFEIKRFDEVNRRFGHAAGDRMLNQAAAALKVPLREMDFLARSSSDEFLAILPTADETVAERIVDRINAELLSIRFEAGGSESVEFEVDSGIAMFGRHGESAETLIAAARMRRQIDMPASSSSVIWFPGNSVS